MSIVREARRRRRLGRPALGWQRPSARLALRYLAARR